jgi:hypothetical protein
VSVTTEKAVYVEEFLRRLDAGEFDRDIAGAMGRLAMDQLIQVALVLADRADRLCPPKRAANEQCTVSASSAVR